MNISIDIDVKGAVRRDSRPNSQSSWRPLILSKNGVKGDIVISGSSRELAVNHLINVTLEGKTHLASVDTPAWVRIY